VSVNLIIVHASDKILRFCNEIARFLFFRAVERFGLAQVIIFVLLINRQSTDLLVNRAQAQLSVTINGGMVDWRQKLN
jgi:hypothetical protein